MCIVVKFTGRQTDKLYLILGHPEQFQVVFNDQIAEFQALV